jgi:predicted PurR-regulated permease PerM
MSEPRISISLSTILSILAVVLLVALLWQLQSLLVLLMISVVLAATIAPLVDWAEQRKIPRWLAVISIFLALIGGFVGIGLLIGPTVINQTEALISQIPLYSEKLYAWVQDIADRLGNDQPEVLRQLVNPQAIVNWGIRSSQELVLRSFGLTRDLLGILFSTVLVLLMSGYMVIGSDELIRGFVQLFPHPWDQRLLAQVAPATKRMGGFILGRAIVSAILGVVITIGLGVLGLPQFSLALGVIAAITNLIPLIGPILGAIPAIVVSLAQGGLIWVWVLLLFAIVQNLEGNILTPLVIGSSIRLHPLYILLAVLGGTQVLGFLGALIVPPWVAGAAVLLENLYLRPKALAEARVTEVTRELEEVSVN